MKVKLISFSQPVKDIGTPLADAQDLIAFCARVSNPENQWNTDTSEKLVKYLIKHKHWSPLEMVNACLEIETTRDISRQMLRHRSFSFQEFSQRYADPRSILHFDVREARLEDKDNRQNSIETDDQALKEKWIWQQERIFEAAEWAYVWARSKGIAKEQARCVLPEGNTMSRLYMNGSLRSWIHYIEIRTSKETQKEHREVATECLKVITSIFPLLKAEK